LYSFSIHYDLKEWIRPPIAQIELDMENSHASQESNMPTDDENTRPDPNNHDWTWAPTPSAATRQVGRKDVRAQGLNGLMDSQNSAGLPPLGADPTYYESHFGCARCLVWAIVFEAGLAIAVLLFCQLLLLPSW
jgi:hypothetical protein